MNRQEVRVEKPKQKGPEVEFFLQRNAGNQTACAAHIHTAAELLYVREGSYHVTLDDMHFDIGEGEKLEPNAVLLCLPSGVAPTTAALQRYSIALPVPGRRTPP